MGKHKPIVSVCCLVYNHEPFLRQCFEGFVMQHTNFPIEILVHDDASTDHSADIIREYTAKYPGIFKPIYQTENQYSKGVDVFVLNVKRAKGKYIAVCEGDDYWTDPLKLRKQVDFMENHNDVSYVFSKHKKLVGGKLESLPQKWDEIPEITDLHYLLKNSIMPPTQTICFRKSAFPQQFPKIDTKRGDFLLLVVLTHNSKIGYIPEELAVYRVGVGVISKRDVLEWEAKDRIASIKLGEYLNDPSYDFCFNKKRINEYYYQNVTYFYLEKKQFIKATITWLMKNLWHLIQTNKTYLADHHLFNKHYIKMVIFRFKPSNYYL